jgi:DegV family protein with EDD domain
MDRLELTADMVYELMRTGEHPTTSQPTVAKFTEAFEHARAGADSVVAVLLSSGLSGTFGSAEAALKAKPVDGVRLVDSRSASLGQGLLAVRGAELAEAGWDADEIRTELERLRGQSGMFFTVDTLDNLIRSGRVSRLKGWLGNLFDMKPILTLNAEGKVTPVDRVRGRTALLPRVLHLLDEILPKQRQRLRMGVVHADNEAVARKVRDTLHKRYHPVDIIVSPVTAVIGVHTGPGAWGVFWQIEDGIPDRPGNKSGS